MTWSRKALPLPEQEELLRIFSYDPLTGELRWRIRPARPVQVGDLIKSTDSAGHIQVMYKKRLMLAHRVIWKMVTGREPVGTIDHKNVIPNDNRWDNLREATNSQQAMNRNKAKKNELYKGVRLPKGRKKYTAAATIDGKQIRLGSFDTPEEARDAYNKAATEHYGAFARLA